MPQTVIALFENEDTARTAWRELEHDGFGPTHVSFVDREINRLADNLMQVGIPEIDALTYLDAVKLGHVVIVLQSLPEPTTGRAVELLNRYPTLGFESAAETGVAEPATLPGATRMVWGNCYVYAGNETVVPIVGDELHRPKVDPPGGGVLDRDVREYPAHVDY